MNDNEFWSKIWKYPVLLIALIMATVVICTVNSDYQKRMVVTTTEHPIEAGCAYGITAADVCVLKAAK